MTFTGTATTPPALRNYRERHTIVLSREWDEDMGRFTPVCAHDGIRVYERSPGRLAHDTGEIKQLAAFERGERVAW